MITISEYSSRVARERARCALLGSALAASVLLTRSAVTEAQSGVQGRLWAAQTGVNQITLVWDSVPGTTEYRVYLGGPGAPGTFSQRPALVLSGRSRRANLTGVQRAANGMTLVAIGAGGRVLQQAQFNPVTPATFFPPATPPTGVTAQATSASVVIVTWDSVPGATGYVIGRSVHRSGFRMLCSLCPNEARYVDQNVMAGLPHTYVVSAIFPSGDVSKRTVSTPVTPGATPVVTAPVVTAPGVPTGTMPTTTPTATPTGAMPTTASAATPPGVPTGARPSSTPGYTPPGQPAATIPAATSPPTTAGTVTHAATSPTTGAATSPSGTTAFGTAVGNTISRIDSMLSGILPRDSTGSALPGLGGMAGQAAVALSGGVAPPPSVTVTATGPGTVVISWQPSPTPGITGYTVNRSLNGARLEELVKVSPTELSHTDRFFPATVFASGAVKAKYGVVATGAPGFRGIVSGEVVVQPTASTPAPGSGSPAACRLDYRRADNMWAAFGSPTGSLAAESVSLTAGQNKVFITDWKYEKQPNDGTNFYGSHLRIATNATSSTIRLHLRSWTLTGLQVFARTGHDTFWIRLDPNTTRQFQADLMEVFCEG